MTDIITKPSNYCRADGVKVRITCQDHEGDWVEESNMDSWYSSGDIWQPKNLPPHTPNMNIISTWSDRPDEHRKPKPAYRKDGSPRWPVGTRAVLVAWEDGPTNSLGDTITVMDDGLPYWAWNGAFGLLRYGGNNPLFRKIKDAAPKPEPRELVLYGKDGHGSWGQSRSGSDTHRLSLTIIGDQVTGTLESL